MIIAYYLLTNLSGILPTDLMLGNRRNETRNSNQILSASWKELHSKFIVLKNITFLSEPLVSFVYFVYLEEHSSLH
jgi:hypothetical protein